MHDQVPFIKPKLPDPKEIASDLARIYKNNYFSNNGPVYYEFKAGLEKYLGQGINTVVVSNATLGLMIAIHAVFGESKGKKKYIAIPSFTFSAGPLAIKWAGFEPIFFDVDIDTTQPSIESFKKLLSSEHKDEIAGVVLVNNFGIGNAQIKEWENLLGLVGIEFIIDSAPGLGATYSDGSYIGGRGKTEVFSLHVTKPFGIGEGGLLTTTDAGLAKRYESLKNFGFNENHETDELGMNAKITELDCAIGLRILKKYPAILDDRRKTYHKYVEKLSNNPVRFLPRADTAAIQFASIIVDTAMHKTILNNLHKGNVDARTYYAPAVHTFPHFSDCARTDLANTETLSSTIISLPVHPEMPDETIAYVCGIITDSL